MAVEFTCLLYDFSHIRLFPYREGKLNVVLRKTLRKLEFMFIKHYAPNRCEPKIEVIVKMPKKVGAGDVNWLIVKMPK